jgi:hypothetical protein
MRMRTFHVSSWVNINGDFSRNSCNVRKIAFYSEVLVRLYRKSQETDRYSVGHRRKHVNLNDETRCRRECVPEGGIWVTVNYITFIIISRCCFRTLKIEHTSCSYDHLCGLVRRPGYRSRSGSRVPAIPDFVRSSGSGTGFTQPPEYNWGATWKKK